MPQNQVIYAEFNQTIQMLIQHKANIERDIAAVEQQLLNMKREWENIEQSIILNTGGMSSVEVLTNHGYAIIKYEGEEPLILNPNQAAPVPPQQQPQAAPSQVQYQQQPTQAAYTPQPAITQEAQTQFAPTPPPMTPMIQQPQMGQINQPTPPPRPPE